MTEPRPLSAVDRGPEIVERLQAIEADHDVRILYAVESGSRAWGFDSPNSDWDVRFLYVHAEDWYLSIHEERDVIEVLISDELDISGWDLRKSLRLMVKGNPVLFEWLRSPIVYLEGMRTRTGGRLMDGFREVAAPFFNPVAAVHHYWHMARNNFRGYMLGEVVRLKKYFYVLRPVLACQWILQGHGQPPMQFQALLARLIGPGALRDEIEDLLILKRAEEEMAEGARRPAIHAFLDASLAEIEQWMQGVTLPPRSGEARRAAECLFRELVRAEDWRAM